MTSHVVHAHMRKLAASLIGLLSLIALVFTTTPIHAQAAQISDIVTQISLTDSSGAVVNSGNNTNIQHLRIDFRLPDYAVQEGDTSTITLPQEFVFADATSFDVTTPDGSAVVAHVTINPQTHSATMTYTDYPSQHSDTIGTLNLSTRIDTDNVTTERTFPVVVYVGQDSFSLGNFNYTGFRGESGQSQFVKWAWRTNDDAGKNIIHYAIRVNPLGPYYDNVTVHDTIQSQGMSYKKDSFSIHRGNWYFDNGQWSMPYYDDQTGLTPTFSADDHSFEINFGVTGPAGYLVQYDVELDSTPHANDIFNNSASLTYGNNNVYATDNALYTWQGASGEATGNQYTVNIEKTDELGSPLEGAVFSLTRENSTDEIARVTTDAQGKASIPALIRDSYILSEIQAPTGYSLAQPIRINANQFDANTHTAQIRVIDRAMTSLEVTKNWDDDSNSQGIRPQSISLQLLANGSPHGNPVAIQSADNWTYTFKDLPARDANNNLITYTVREVNVPSGYIAHINKTDSTHVTITNSLTPIIPHIPPSPGVPPATPPTPPTPPATPPVATPPTPKTPHKPAQLARTGIDITWLLSMSCTMILIVSLAFALRKILRTRYQ
ncbi:Cna B-type domain-containing protein [Alloscardovia theropitheci]|uniref:Cna B-type domain-containing protein n=1 Tax=Alloscardovia theropitheci TaxID=2496842 RepID=A0A4R0QY97_9BIFI|nr:Cna B-type domain-containing protein [Alloscardovia theropitheci]TCD54551.1 Cna B-type domain-containing protein [Alloscardovia theropitheci]